MNHRLLNIGMREITYYVSTIMIALCVILYFNNFIDIKLSVILLLICFLPFLFIVGIENLFILLILLSYIPLVFTFGGVKGWQIRDFVVPIFLLWWFAQSVIKREPLNRLPRFSIPLLLFLFVALAHVSTLDELPKIAKSFISLKIPSGELRMFYTLFISGVVCFLSPFFFKKESQILLFVKYFGGIFLLLVIFCFIRIYLGIDSIFPTEASDMRIHYVRIGDNVVPRLSILGRAGYLLFIVGLIFLKNRSTTLFLLLTSLSIAGIVVSGGRAAFLGLLFATGFYLYLTGKKYRAILLPLGALLLLLFLGLSPKITDKLPSVLHRHLKIISSENPSLSLNESTRMEMWTISWEIISRHPFWGARSVDDSWKYNEGAFINVKKGGAHNTYLSIAASFGLPALVLWLIASVSYFRKIIHLYKKTISYPLLNRFCLMLTILLGVSFFMFFMEGYVGGGFQYFLYLGLIDSAWNMYYGNQKRMTQENNLEDS